MQIIDLPILVFFAAVNVLARVVMKDVANCDTHCELRDSVNQQTVERMRYLHLGEGVPGSVFDFFVPCLVFLNIDELCANASFVGI